MSVKQQEILPVGLGLVALGCFVKVTLDQVVGTTARAVLRDLSLVSISVGATACLISQTQPPPPSREPVRARVPVRAPVAEPEPSFEGRTMFTMKDLDDPTVMAEVSTHACREQNRAAHAGGALAGVRFVNALRFLLDARTVFPPGRLEGLGAIVGRLNRWYHGLVFRGLLRNAEGYRAAYWKDISRRLVAALHYDGARPDQWGVTEVALMECWQLGRYSGPGPFCDPTVYKGFYNLFAEVSGRPSDGSDSLARTDRQPTWEDLRVLLKAYRSWRVAEACGLNERS